jgi:hypothetical protein
VTDSKARRKELVEEYQRSGPEAGVYRFVNARAGKALLGSTLNLGSMRGKLDFARATRSPSALDRRLHADAREFGIDSIELEVLEVLEPRADQTPAQVRADLEALESLWRERFNAAELY